MTKTELAVYLIVQILYDYLHANPPHCQAKQENRHDTPSTSPT